MQQQATVLKSPIGIKKKRRLLRDFIAQWDLQLLVIPAIIHIFIFAYIPIYGVVMAFQEFRLGDFVGQSAWVGLRHFERLLTDPGIGVAIRNTLAISLLKMAIIFPAPIIFAVLLNEMKNKHVRKAIQTISYLPFFISWVVAAALMFDFFSIEGAVNSAMLSMGFEEAPIHFFGRGDLFWSMAVITDLWKLLGWNSIIFFAAISSIDAELYEAAKIDGAGRFAQMWHITISTILPTIILLFVFTIGGLMNANFEQMMTLTNQMGNALLRPYADVLNTYVFRVGISGGRFSFAAAAGLFTSVVNFLLLLLANKLADRAGHAVF